jgi:dihydroorotase
MRRITLAALGIAVSLCLAGSAFAAGATKDECVAKSKEAAAMVNEKGLDAAVAEINKKDGKFVWKDTYVFLMDLDGKMIAHPMSPALIGKNLLDMPDKGTPGKLLFKEMVALAKSGAVAFSDDGKTIMDSGVMRRVLEYSTLAGVPVMTHAEDRTLCGNGVLNEGPVATRLGLPGNPGIAEAVHVARDLMLAEFTGAHLHVAHVSTAQGVELVRRARERGVNVTAEVAPHHLTLTDEAALGYDTNAKVAPPLRSAADRDACCAGLADGTLDAIATDHAPHAQHEKELDFTEAPPGMIGFETAAPVTLELVRSGLLSPLEWVRRLSTNPARILSRPGGSLALGSVADVTLIDPEQAWRYDPAKGFSKSRNSPWAGSELRGRVVATIVGGRLVFDVERGVLV